MKIATLRRAFGKTLFGSLGTVAIVALLLASSYAMATTVTTLGGGDPNVKPKYFGYKDGTTLSVALFHTPSGIAVDSSGNFLYVADRDNNAIRYLDLGAGWTYTFTTNKISKPISVALDSSNNLYVLNRGSTNNFSTNGTVLEFDSYGDLIATNAIRLTNAAGMALDAAGDIYVTVKSNTLIRIAGTNMTIVATIPNAGTSLQGIIVKRNGLIAACDSGRNGIYLIDPTTGIVTTNAGFHGGGDFTTANDVASPSTAQFNHPMNVAEAGDGSLIVTDYGNNRVKVVNTAGVVTNLYGIASNYWGGAYPGWYDGSVSIPDSIAPNAQARLPVGVAFASDGTVYTTEDYYHIIRKVTGTGLPLPPPPPPPPPTPATPIIGTVSFPPPDNLSVLTPVTSSIFNNDVIIAIEGTNGTGTYYTAGITGTVPDPSSTNGSTAPYYSDGLSSVADLGVTRYPDMTIKAVNVNADGKSSSITSARFQFETANPTITGNNAAQFTVTDLTTNALMYYTTDSSDPTTNSATSIGPIASGTTLSLSITTNTTFKIRAFRADYEPSAIISATFSPSNFVANTISFGFASGEASSDFIASPGQIFYAPVTLAVLSATKMYSLQFNITITNAGPNPGPSFAGALGFQSMLLKPDSANPGLFMTIPPAMFVNYTTNITTTTSGVVTNYIPNFTNLVFADNNLLGVGWLERAEKTNLYDTTAQDLIQYSQAHDDTFLQSGGQVVVGGYAFQVPANGTNGQTYQIQIGRPTATSDGIGAPGSLIYIATPTNGAINAEKIVTLGQRKYIAGDAYPFRWFNAGDFGNTNLENADVEQVFQSAIYSLNYPPVGSDFFDSMDSCGAFGAYNSGTGYYTKTATLTTNDETLLFNGNDTTVNQIAFGDGQLDVCDVYVTFRRSLDPSLTWFRRFWTNGVLVAETVPNVSSQFAIKSPAKAQPQVQSVMSPTNSPQVNFSAGDFQGSAGQTVQIPITAQIFGNYPLRVLMLNLTIVPLDGSPALTTPISFSSNPALETAALTDSTGNNNYAAAWLNSSITGLTGNNIIGTLTVTIPTTATGSSAYAIHFDHASASPNGLASFPKQTLTGLITLSSRTNSSYSDGIPDSWRLRYFGTINNMLSVSNADADGDGMNNWQEYVAGTDPNDAQSVFKNIGIDPLAAQQSSDAVISWPSVNGKQYVIECSSTLFPPAWNPIATNNGTGTEMEFHNASGGGTRFYRVSVH